MFSIILNYFKINSSRFYWKRGMYIAAFIFLIILSLVIIKNKQELFDHHSTGNSVGEKSIDKFLRESGTKDSRFTEMLNIFLPVGFFTIWSFIGVLMVGWSSTYPHLGWKRLALVTSFIAPLSLFIFGQITDSMPDHWQEVLFWIITTAFLAPTVLLAGRDIFFWVKSGFANQK